MQILAIVISRFEKSINPSNGVMHFKTTILFTHNHYATIPCIYHSQQARFIITLIFIWNHAKYWLFHGCHIANGDMADLNGQLKHREMNLAGINLYHGHSFWLIVFSYQNLSAIYTYLAFETKQKLKIKYIEENIYEKKGEK